MTTISSAYDFISQYNFEQIRRSIYSCTAADVEHALEQERLTIGDFQALVSPAATPFLAAIAHRAQAATRQRFGRTMRLYIPLYISNICSNSCLYCGFSCQNKIERRRLSLGEIEREAEAIRKMGFRQLLLVSGEDMSKGSFGYYLDVVKLLRSQFAQLSLEVQPLECNEYKALREAGISYVCIYQETYEPEAYKRYHPAGRKADYRYRLETPDRIAEAGIEKIGIGALLGLSDWRTDAAFTALHLQYLRKRYWQSNYSISLPRLRPATGAFEPAHPINDLGMLQLIAAFRLFDPEVEISLSTRESKAFRDGAIGIGITSMSAGSSTEPGGYAEPNKQSLEQFSINDQRSPAALAADLQRAGYDAVWKDHDEWL